MAGRYLTDLADVIKGAGLPTFEMEGWRTRSRKAGGYLTGRPNTVMVHHTASPKSADGLPDARYMCFGSENKPIANLYIDRTGLIWILAAGCTNTNGVGKDTWGGGVPENQMNGYAIGIEAGNDGIGEQWPKVQQDNYVRMCRVLCDHYGIRYNNVRAHFEYAVGRKIDPAGPSKWAVGRQSWRMDQYRGDVSGSKPPQPQPKPPPLEDDMAIAIFESHTNPKEFHAMFFAEVDSQGRSIELQWSGSGDDPRVQERIKTMMDNFGPSRPLLLAGVRNNRLHAKHRPSDIIDSAKQGGWSEADFAP